MSQMAAERLALPCSIEKRCLDRFGILDIEEDDEGLVPLWTLVEAVLQRPVMTSSDVVDIFEALSYCAHGSLGPAGDYGILRRTIETFGARFFQTIWPRIASFALRLPTYFRESTLEILIPGKTVRLEARQVASLVAHQFLCTLDVPSWRSSFQDFSIWYGSRQRHPGAVEMYLHSLFTYLDSLDLPVLRSCPSCPTCPRIILPQPTRS